MGGFDDLRIVEIPAGELFQIHVYDGYESIIIFDSSKWTRAV